MPPPLSISLALQPSSFHNLPTNSRAREVLTGRSRRRSSSTTSSSFPSCYSPSSLQSQSQPYRPCTPSLVSSCESRKYNNVEVSSRGNTAYTITAISDIEPQPSSSLTPSAFPLSQTSVPSTVPSCHINTNHHILKETGKNNRDNIPRDQGVASSCTLSDLSSSTLANSRPLSSSSPAGPHSNSNSHSLSHSQSHLDLKSTPAFEPSITSNPISLDTISLDSQKNPSQSLSGPNSVLWKAYSRVKQTITDTQSVNPLGTMSDYWHSLGAPRIQDLHQQYMQINPSSTTDPLTMKLSVHTATHSEQFPPMQQLISPPESSASNSPYSFHDKTITENCYIDCSRVVAKEPTSTLPISSVPLSPSLQSLSGSDSTSEATSKVHPKCSDTSLNHPSQLSSIEDGQPLEQRSISLSDNTADLPELSETYGSCSKEILAQNAKPQLGAPKAKFFLYDSEDSEGSDMEQESMTITPHTIGMSPFIRQQTEEHHHDGDCEDFDTPDEQHDIDDEDFFGKKMPIVSPFQYQSNKSDLSSFRSGTGVRPHPPYCAVMGRRQSLLSDLLLAEKQQKSQQSDSLSIPSAPNSDGETTALHKATVPVSQGYLMSPQQQHRRGSYMERSGINHISKNRSHNVSAMHEDMSDRTVPSLVRTKKVYKNLAELAKAKAPATPENSLLLSASPRATKSTAAKAATSIMNTTTTTPSLSSNTTCILSTSPAISTNGWTRTQVQVQIQSLVTHSTSTAQRALLSASATLADVLFRTTH